MTSMETTIPEAPTTQPMIVRVWMSSKDYKFRVRITGANGEKVMDSQAYVNKGGAVRAANRIVEAGKAGFVLKDD